MSNTTQAPAHSSTALKRLERNQQYSVMLQQQQQKQEEMQEQQHREEALAKQNYNIRPQPGTSGSYAVRPSSVSKQTIADQLRKNRAYDTSMGTGHAGPIPQEENKTAAAAESESAGRGTEEEYSGLSNSLVQTVADVTSTVQALQVGTLASFVKLNSQLNSRFNRYVGEGAGPGSADRGGRGAARLGASLRPRGARTGQEGDHAECRSA